MGQNEDKKETLILPVKEGEVESHGESKKVSLGFFFFFFFFFFFSFLVIGASR
jgi:hypothetical protein